MNYAADGGEVRAAPADRARILVADDHPDSRMILAAVLRAEGHIVHEVEDGRAAVEAVREQPPDAVVLDILMPRLDGYRACAAIRETEALHDLPIVMLTGGDDPEAARKAFEAGATDFASKPVEWVTFRQRIRFLLRSKRVIEALRRSDARLEIAQGIARLGTWELDVARMTVSLSPMAACLLGLAPDDESVALQALVGQLVSEDRETVDARIRAAARGDSPLAMDCALEMPDGSRLALRLQAETARPNHHGQLFVPGTLQDVTDRKEVEQRIRTLAYYDGLTGLPNRVLFTDTLGAALSRARRHGGTLAVMFIDLDRFKRINDTMGHSAGDQLLRVVGQRLREVVRAEDTVGRNADGEPSEVARLGGDEFIVHLVDLRRPEDAARVARRLLETLGSPVKLGSSEVLVSASIGIALYPRDGADVEDLLKNADVALYHAKDSGRNNYQFYETSMNASAFQRLLLEGSFRRALERGELFLQYQPQVRAGDGKLIGLEALVRWRHPELGMVRPSEFIPLAEDTGLIVPMGNWVILEACRQIARWCRTGLGPVRVAVNVSGSHFRHGQIVEIVSRTLAETGAPPGLLELEITESSLMDSVNDAVRTLDEVKALGPRIAIDDFGTGYSSLGYLKRFPIDALKIDQSFVRDITTDPDDAAIVSAIVALARALDLEVVAEGVENKAQREYLEREGCHFLQGYFFGMPMPVEEAEAMLRGSGPPAKAPPTSLLVPSPMPAEPRGDDHGQR